MKAGWTEAALGELATIERHAVRPAEIADGTLYVGLENIERGGAFRNVREVCNGELASAKFTFDASNILYGKLRPNLGKIARPSFAGVCSTDILPIAPGSAVDRDYLAHFLARPESVRLAADRATGANLPRINPRELESFRIVVPPLAEQQRIANILDIADGLRRVRIRSIDRALCLSPAIYHHLFGGEQGFQTTRLGEIADVVSGITKGRRVNGQLLTEVPYLAVVNVQDGHLSMSPLKTIAATRQEIARYRLIPGDLLLTEGGDPDKLGRGALWSGEVETCIHQNHVFRVRIHNPGEIDPVFLRAELASSEARGYFLRAAKQTTGIASINKSQLCSMPVSIPPIRLQHTFVERVRSVRQTVEHYRRHMANLDSLLAALQHRAFNGEL